jgi:hypothetical protein
MKKDKNKSIPELGESARNKKLAKHLRSRGYFAIEIMNPASLKEVSCLIVSAGKSPDEILRLLARHVHSH